MRSDSLLWLLGFGLVGFWAWQKLSPQASANASAAATQPGPSGTVSAAVSTPTYSASGGSGGSGGGDGRVLINATDMAQVIESAF